MDYLFQYRGQIENLCRQHKVKTLFAFGSVLNTRFNEKSDLDFIVDFDGMPVQDYADNYFNLKFSLQDLLQKPVDLLEESSIRNPLFRKIILDQRQLFYGA